MLLNPLKFVSRVSGGKCLGFLLSEWGIKTNLDKCDKPKNLKEVQRLVGRLTSLA